MSRNVSLAAWLCRGALARWSHETHYTVKWAGSKALALVTPVATAVDSALNFVIDTAGLMKEGALAAHYRLKHGHWQQLPSDWRDLLRGFFSRYAFTGKCLNATLHGVIYNLVCTDAYSRLLPSPVEEQAERLVEAFSVWEKSFEQNLDLAEQLWRLPGLPKNASAYGKGLAKLLQSLAWQHKIGGFASSGSRLGAPPRDFASGEYARLIQLLNELPPECLFGRFESGELLCALFNSPQAVAELPQIKGLQARLCKQGAEAAFQLFVQPPFLIEELVYFIQFLQQLYPAGTGAYKLLEGRMQSFLPLRQKSPKAFIAEFAPDEAHLKALHEPAQIATVCGRWMAYWTAAPSLAKAELQSALRPLKERFQAMGDISSLSVCELFLEQFILFGARLEGRGLREAWEALAPQVQQRLTVEILNRSFDCLLARLPSFAKLSFYSAKTLFWMAQQLDSVRWVNRPPRRLAYVDVSPGRVAQLRQLYVALTRQLLIEGPKFAETNNWLEQLKQTARQLGPIDAVERVKIAAELPEGASQIKLNEAQKTALKSVLEGLFVDPRERQQISQWLNKRGAGLSTA